METIYHYTSLIHLEKILQDGYLKVSDADRKFGIKPAIWFSKNTNWEPTATKMVFNGSEMVELTQEEQQKTIGMVRFGIPFSNQLVSWRKYGHIGKIAPKLHAALEQIGIEKGARPGQWYCSL
ncbi:MAG: hypothetical protein IPI93_10500 [Sphingobacteriaceae bacterium]|nr:hypothetical protein [Sphingobacteriaceae bacterium]